MNEAEAFLYTNVLLYLLSEDETKVNRAEQVIDGRLTIRNPFVAA
jgi:predicted nucleic acid-binding protein